MPTTVPVGSTALSSAPMLPPRPLQPRRLPVPLSARVAYGAGLVEELWSCGATGAFSFLLRSAPSCGPDGFDLRRRRCLRSAIDAGGFAAEHAAALADEELFPLRS
ncbi:MAG: hypothetical protein ACLSDQ_01300 [Adlercreutzia equolifaciens]